MMRYIALGDSISIDMYPALDAGGTDVAVALERAEHAGNIEPLGAASLLFRNDEERFPDELANDLVSQFPGLEFQNLAANDASIGDVFGEQLAQVAGSDEPTLVTLTIGSNDLLSAFSTKPRASLLEAILRDIRDAYDFLLDSIRGTLPGAQIIITTLSDPSDGTGKIPGVLEDVGALPLHALAELNDHIRTLGSGTPNVIVADAYQHFLGHGASVPQEERWYWKRSQVELNLRGAHELRMLWLDVARQRGIVA